MRLTPKPAIALLVATVLTAAALPRRERSVNPVDGKEKALGTLSEYGFFVGPLADLAPAEGVLPYALNTPLFSDYAEKARFVRLPPGGTMGYREGEVLDLPVGSFLIKNFYYPVDARDPARGRRIVETRLLKHTERGWQAWGYVWNDEQTEAHYSPLGTKTEVVWTDLTGEQRTIEYEAPNQFQCKGCHSFEGELRPIGPSARQLHGGAGDYLARWHTAGLLTGVPDDPTDWPVMDWRAPGTSVELRARAYLDANCGYCHRPEGPAG